MNSHSNAGPPVCFVPIEARKYKGKIHIRSIKDGICFLIITFKVATLYSLLKVFFPMSFILFIAGVDYYLYTFFDQGRLTNMNLLLLSPAVIIVLIGIILEQITALNHKDSKH